MKPRVIALLTDYGLSDPYAGIMKGAILARAPKIKIVDLCHDVPPQNVRAAAFYLRRAAPYFPKGTLFVVIVDPGVGSSRRVLWASGKDRSFLAPDNGCLSWLKDKPAVYRSVENPKLHLKPLSRTFHGRDIFAPTAAALVLGESPSSLGPRVEPEADIPFPRPQRLPNGALRGEILAVDRFGNAVTCVPADSAKGRAIFFRGRPLGACREYYAQAKPGQALALIGSSGFLELAVRNGNFAQACKAKEGDHVELR